MSNGISIKERIRMVDTYNSLNKIVDDLREIDVSLPLVWVWVWDVVRSRFESPDEGESSNGTLQQAFELLWRDTKVEGFTLEYGAESCYEHVSDWMVDKGILVMVKSDSEMMTNE